MGILPSSLPLLYEMMEQIFKPHERVFIVCTGESLKGFDFSLLRDERVISVNWAFRFLERWDIMAAMDSSFYVRNHTVIRSLQEERPFIICAIQDYDPGKEKSDLVTHWMISGGVAGVDYRPGYVRHAYNSGYFGINVAIQFGARDIRILGMDISEDHFYCPGKVGPGYEHLIKFGYLDQLAQDLTKDIRITNYSMISKCQAFPKRPLNKIFEPCHCQVLQ